jgi:hypothetical protein
VTDIVTLSDLPLEIARQIGAAPQLAGVATPEPETTLDWALHWAARGLHIFPCERFLGRPMVPKWYTEATNNAAQIVEWWAAHPTADIGVVPEHSGHFVLSAVGEDGLESLDALEAKYGEFSPDFTTFTGWETEHLWFKGRALSSHNRLGLGLHVFGAGTHVYLPPSWAPLSIE